MFGPFETFVHLRFTSDKLILLLCLGLCRFCNCEWRGLGIRFMIMFGGFSLLMFFSILNNSGVGMSSVAYGFPERGFRQMRLR